MQKTLDYAQEWNLARDTLTGSRIRERRVAAGMRQADLARSAEISASYLNLIEHNRRRIGGKLLVRIAELLQVDPSMLSEGAGAARIAALREAASAMSGSEAEVDRADEFAGRFPGWAQLLVECHTRIGALERTVEALSDRMTHDPQLAASLHEMLSTVTAIHSSASILAEPGEIDADWQARFHRNIHEDSARLADASRSLVTYLEANDTETAESGVPQEELDAVLASESHHVAALENGGAVSDAHTRLGRGLSKSARALLRSWLQRYADDAQAVPMEAMRGPVQKFGADPAALATALKADPLRIMRRLAAMPADILAEPVGLAICDASGVLSYRKPLPDFPMPRFGAACPVWPLYRALSRPMVLLSGALMQAGRPGITLWSDAVAAPQGGIVINREPLYEAHMLVRLASNDTGAAPQEVGVACRICPRRVCEGRREPSILG